MEPEEQEGPLDGYASDVIAIRTVLRAMLAMHPEREELRSRVEAIMSDMLKTASAENYSARVRNVQTHAVTRARQLFG